MLVLVLLGTGTVFGMVLLARVAHVPVPGTGIAKVKDLARSDGGVALPTKQLGERGNPRNTLPPRCLVGVDARHVRGDPREHRGTRGVADGRVAVRLYKRASARGEGIEVRRAGLRMAPRHTRPVVEIVDGDKEDVGSLCAGMRRGLQPRPQRRAREAPQYGAAGQC